MTETREAMRSIDLAELAASSGMSAAISQSATREPYKFVPAVCEPVKDLMHVGMFLLQLTFDSAIPTP